MSTFEHEVVPEHFTIDGKTYRYDDGRLIPSVRDEGALAHLRMVTNDDTAEPDWYSSKPLFGEHIRETADALRTRASIGKWWLREPSDEVGWLAVRVMVVILSIVAMALIIVATWWFVEPGLRIMQRGL